MTHFKEEEKKQQPVTMFCMFKLQNTEEIHSKIAFLSNFFPLPE